MRTCHQPKALLEECPSLISSYLQVIAILEAKRKISCWPQGGPDRGLGWEGMFGQPWPKQNDGMGPTKDTNPLGMMEEKLTAEVTK